MYALKPQQRLGYLEEIDKTQRVKPMYTYLKHAFDGIVIDEGVKIKSRHSQLGIAGRSLPSGLLQFCLPTLPLY